MSDPDLLSYLEQHLAEGFSQEELRATLKKSGWSDQEIFDGFAALEAMSAKVEAETIVAPVVVTESQSEDEGVSEVRGTTYKKVLVVILGLMAALFLLGGLVFAYSAGYFNILFGRGPVDEEIFLSSILASLGTIETAEYTFEGSFTMSDREADAVPFVLAESETSRRDKEAYQRDRSLLSSATAIPGHLGSYFAIHGRFPNSLSDLDASSTAPYRLNRTGFVFPSAESKQLFDEALRTGRVSYRNENNGAMYSFSVNLESATAIKTIEMAHEKARKQFPTMVPRTPAVLGSTVILNQNVWVSPLPPYPKSFQENLEAMMQFMPPRMKVLFSVSTQADTTAQTSDFKSNVNLDVDFDDLVLKFNADAIKKGDGYFIRFNNFPSVYESFLPIEKNQWFSFSESTATSTFGSYREMTNFTRNFETGTSPQLREEGQQFVQEAIRIADEMRVIRFKDAPRMEEVAGEKRYRYDLTFDKNTIIAYYKRLQSESAKYPTLQGMNIFTSKQVIEYMEGPTFGAIFDYVIKNVTFTIWTDTSGLPRIIENAVRIVPPDTVERLNKQQGVAKFRLLMDDINKPFTIDLPTDVKKFEDLESVYVNPLFGASWLSSTTDAILQKE